MLINCASLVGRRRWLSAVILKAVFSFVMDEQIKICIQLPPTLRGRTAVVTGSTSGIGLELAKQLLERGARVLVHGRSENRCRNVAEALANRYGSDMVWYQHADLSNFDQVRNLADWLNTKSLHKIDLLFLNAGMSYAGYKGPVKSESSGMDLLYTSNFLGPILLTHLLLPSLESSDLPARVVLTSSILQWAGEPDQLTSPPRFDYSLKGLLAAYANSKLALNVFATELAARLKHKGSKVQIQAFAPGMVQSNLSIPVDQRDKLISAGDPSRPPELRRFTTFDGARYTLMAAFAFDDFPMEDIQSSSRILIPYRVPGFLLWGEKPFLLRTAALWLAENMQKATACSESLFLWPAHPACLNREFTSALWESWNAQLPSDAVSLL